MQNRNGVGHCKLVPPCVVGQPRPIRSGAAWRQPASAATRTKVPVVPEQQAGLAGWRRTRTYKVVFQLPALTRLPRPAVSLGAVLGFIQWLAARLLVVPGQRSGVGLQLCVCRAEGFRRWRLWRKKNLN